jgi:predicted MFS family arabinose efflux permease
VTGDAKHRQLHDADRQAGGAPEATTAAAADAVDGEVVEAIDALVDGDRELVPGSARAALRHPTFRRFFVGAFLSNIGTWGQNVVLGALAYDLTESSTFVGVLVFAQLGPMLLLSMVGGALVDIVDRRKLIGGVAFLQLILSFVLALVAAPDDPSLALLVGVVFAIGVCQAIFVPAYSAILPQLVGPKDLPGAISLNSVQMNASRVVGPVIGAFLDSSLGASAVFAANGLSYLFIIAAVLAVRLPPPAPRDGRERGMRQFTAGLALARRDTVVRRCLVSIATFSLVSLVFVGQFPVVAERNLGIDERSAAYGWLYACFGVGGVTGALAVGTVLSKIRRERMVSPALVAFSVMLAAFALVRSPALGYPLIFLVGLTYFTFLTALSTVLQERVTNRERGRVTALWIMGFGGTVPVGNLLAGPIIEATSVTAVLLAGAVSAFGLAFYTRYTRLDAPARLDSRAELEPKAA